MRNFAITLLVAGAGLTHAIIPPPLVPAPTADPSLEDPSLMEEDLAFDEPAFDPSLDDPSFEEDDTMSALPFPNPLSSGTGTFPTATGIMPTGTGVIPTGIFPTGTGIPTGVVPSTLLTFTRGPVPTNAPPPPVAPENPTNEEWTAWWKEWTAWAKEWSWGKKGGPKEQPSGTAGTEVPPMATGGPIDDMPEAPVASGGPLPIEDSFGRL